MSKMNAIHVAIFSQLSGIEDKCLIFNLDKCHCTDDQNRSEIGVAHVSVAIYMANSKTLSSFCCLALFCSCWAIFLLVSHSQEMNANARDRDEQRVSLKFLVRSGHTPIQCWRQMRTVYGANCMGKTQVRMWWKRFDQGETSTKDKPKSGRPKSS